MILPDQDIRELVRERGGIVDADLDSCLSPASYELRVGSIREIGSAVEQKLAKGQEFVVKPGSSILIGTLETVNLPADIAGLLFLKSSLGRAGYLCWSQGFVDPGYRGSLTIALHNIAGQLQLFQGHQKICHLVLFRLTRATANPYSGEYANSTGATATKTRTPIVVGAAGIQMLTEATKIVGDESLRTLVAEQVKAILGR